MTQHKFFWPLVIRDDAQRSHVAPAELENTAPVARGYWLDEEVMNIAGIESASIVMKMKWAKAVEPSHIAIKPKGRRRAWSARNVFRALLTAEIARLGRMSFLAAARIVGASYVDHLDRLLRLDALLQEVQSRVEVGAVSDTWFQPHEIENPANGCALVIDDWTMVFWCKEGEPRQPLVRIDALEKKNPEVHSTSRNAGGKDIRVRLTIPMRPIIDRFLNAIAATDRSVG